MEWQWRLAPWFTGVRFEFTRGCVAGRGVLGRVGLGLGAAVPPAREERSPPESSGDERSRSPVLALCGLCSRKRFQSRLWPWWVEIVKNSKKLSDSTSQYTSEQSLWWLSEQKRIFPVVRMFRDRVNQIFVKWFKNTSLNVHKDGLPWAESFKIWSSGVGGTHIQLCVLIKAKWFTFAG